MRSYLDHNATSPLRPAARRAMLAALEEGGNASSVHAEGRAARRHLDDARDVVAQAVGASCRAWLSSRAAAARPTISLSRAPQVDRMLVSAIEHPSVLEAARASGKTVEIIPVTPCWNGRSGRS